MMNAVRKTRLLLAWTVPALAILTGGCVSRDISDLEHYAEEVLSRPGGTIEPLPPIRPYERYLYEAEKLGSRDPFRSFFEIAPEKEKLAKAVDPNQQKLIDEVVLHQSEELENFELDALRMVGVLENPEALWGIVRDQEGIVHRVQVGNYLGRNFGKIINIQEERIDVREIIKDSTGRYEEREASLALSEE
jgi:type IV pilus assembly protein PilP